MIRSAAVVILNNNIYCLHYPQLDAAAYISKFTCSVVSIFLTQVQVMSNTDIVASPHGAQLTNMLFMDQGSSVMEFFPKGWLEHAGVGQYAHHWMANLSGMKHRGAWWDSNGEECPNPKDHLQCFQFYKDGLVGHNETYFSQWTREVLVQVRLSKLQQRHPQKQDDKTNACAC